MGGFQPLPGSTPNAAKSNPCTACILSRGQSSVPAEPSSDFGIENGVTSFSAVAGMCRDGRSSRVARVALMDRIVRIEAGTEEIMFGEEKGSAFPFCIITKIHLNKCDEESISWRLWSTNQVGYVTGRACGEVTDWSLLEGLRR